MTDIKSASSLTPMNSNDTQLNPNDTQMKNVYSNDTLSINDILNEFYLPKAQLHYVIYNGYII